MADAEDNLQPSKKRAAGRQLSRDNPGLDDDETPEQELGTFKKASDEVLANRKIVKVRRNTSAPTSNPFAGIRLVPPTVPQTTPSAVTTEAESSKNDLEKVEEKSDASKKAGEIHKQPESDIPESKPESTTEKTDNVELKETKLADEKDIKGDKTKEESDDESDANNGDGEAGKEVKSDANNGEGEVVKEVKNDANNGEGEAGKEVKNDAAASEFGVKKEDNVKTVNEENKDGDENAEKSAETTPFSSFQQLSSSRNAFTGLAGSGFSSSSFSFGLLSKDGSGSGSGSLFGMTTEQPAFSFGLPGNGSSLFATPGASIVNKSEKALSMPEVPVETGEENEKAVLTADSVLFEFSEGGWKERGKGELKVNISTTETGKARLVMRTKGNYRLILNASLYPDMKLANMEKKGITFACMNSASEGKDGLSTYALKFKDPSIVEEFRAAVTEHKGKTSVSLKTPENSPKASED